jgi:hypothetical protein
MVGRVTGVPLYIVLQEMSDSMLVLSQLDHSDAGYYQCIATNEAGETKSAARLEVTKVGKPLNQSTSYFTGVMVWIRGGALSILVAIRRPIWPPGGHLEFCIRLHSAL